MKKILFVLLALVSSLFIIIFLPFILGKHIQAIKIDSEIETNEWFRDKVQDYTIIKCNFGLKNSSYTFVYEKKFKTMIDYHVHFFSLGRASIFSQSISAKYTGGTTIKNTTFPELVKMVKEDCSQFQESYYDLTGYENYEELSYDEQTKLWPEIEKNNLNWIYTPAPTEEEIEEENKMSAESFISRLSNEIESQEAWELFIEIYGDPYKMTTEEILKLKEKINKEGEDERIYILDRVTTIHNSWPKLSEKNQQTILAAYGPWEELSDKELADYVERIYTDQEKGKLVLE